MSRLTRRSAYIWSHRGRMLWALAQVFEQGTIAELLERKGAFAALYGGPESRRQEGPLALS